MIDYIAKDAGHLKSTDLKLDFDITQNRVFIAEILKKYRKSLDYSTEEERESFFEMACEINDDDMVRYMIRHDIDVPDFIAVSSLSPEAFRSARKHSGIDRLFFLNKPSSATANANAGFCTAFVFLIRSFYDNSLKAKLSEFLHAVSPDNTTGYPDESKK